MTKQHQTPMCFASCIFKCVLNVSDLVDSLFLPSPVFEIDIALFHKASTPCPTESWRTIRSNAICRTTTSQHHGDIWWHPASPLQNKQLEKKCNSLTNSKLVSDLREQMKNLHSNVRIASSHWYWSTRPNKNVRADIFEKHRNLVFWYVSFRQKFHKIMVCDMFSCSVTNYLAKATFAIHETGWRVVHVFTCFHCAVHFEQTINQV